MFERPCGIADTGTVECHFGDLIFDAEFTVLTGPLGRAQGFLIVSVADGLVGQKGTGEVWGPVFYSANQCRGILTERVYIFPFHRGFITLNRGA